MMSDQMRFNPFEVKNSSYLKRHVVFALNSFSVISKALEGSA